MKLVSQLKIAIITVFLTVVASGRDLRGLSIATFFAEAHTAELTERCEAFYILIYRHLFPTTLSGIQLMSTVADAGASTPTSVWFPPFLMTRGVDGALASAMLAAFNECEEATVFENNWSFAATLEAGFSARVLELLGGEEMEEMPNVRLSEKISKGEKSGLKDVITRRVNLACAIYELFDSYASTELDSILDMLEMYNDATRQFILASKGKDSSSSKESKRTKLPQCDKDLLEVHSK